MKKILSIILALTTILSTLHLISCGKAKDGETLERLATKTPYELYTAERASIGKANHYTITTTKVITQSTAMGGGVSTETTLTKLGGDNAYAKITNSKSPSATTEAWFIAEEGLTYASTSEDKTRYSDSLSGFTKNYLNRNASDLIMLNVGEEVFEEKKFERSGDYWVVSFVLTDEAYQNFIINVFTTGIFDISSLPEGDVTYKIYFTDSGKLAKTVTSYDVSSMSGGSHCEITTEINLSDVSVTPPADASSYEYFNPQQ